MVLEPDSRPTGLYWSRASWACLLKWSAWWLECRHYNSEKKWNAWHRRSLGSPDCLMEVMRVWFLSCDFVCAVITDGHSLNQKFEACWHWYLYALFLFQASCKNCLIVIGFTSGNRVLRRSPGNWKTLLTVSLLTNAVTSLSSSDEHSVPSGWGGTVTLPVLICSGLS